MRGVLCGAHPRSRGENPRVHEARFQRSGSSPLTRGKLARLLKVSPSTGLIPAHAGKTGGAAWCCTEDGGSSPLTRGKHLAAWIAGVTPGLIPAHAGKTWRSWCQSCWWGAHPRSRGENVSAVAALETASGSSPLTRGKRGRTWHSRRGPGLIPAHAGKTRPIQGQSENQTAHPRSRGENRQRVEGADATQGSSPLTRGKPAARKARPSTPGLIPAHAGKTAALLDSSSRERAHPRSRGENRAPGGPLATGPGSSPLTRGKQALLAWGCRR